MQSFPPPALTLASGGGGGAAVDLLVIFATAAIVATVFRRLRLEAIPGYLVAGLLVGPHAFGLIESAASVEQIAGLAIVLLMFGIGLELDVASIRRGMAPILLVGAVSTASFIVFAWSIFMIGGMQAPAALLAAMALSISSTAVLVRMLQQRRETRRIHGRIGLGVSIVQDMLSIGVLAAIPGLAAWAGVASAGGEKLGPAGIAFAAVKGVGGVAVMIAFGRYALPWFLRQVARSAEGPTSELVLIFSVAIALGSAILTGFLGFSPEMGAFLGGFLLTFTPFRHQLGGQLSPVRDLLMAVFFTTVGLAINPASMAEHWVLIIAGTLALVGVKGFIIALSAWTLGTTAPVAVLTGAYLATAGEFTLVVLTAGRAAGVISDHDAAPVVAVVVLSLIIVPSLINPAHALAMRATALHLAPWMKKPKLADDEHPSDDASAPAAHADDSHGHVIIAGFGPVGRALAERLKKSGTPYTVIELNAETIERQSKLGRRVVYGDVTNPEVLESAGVRHADAVILTIPDEESTFRACRLVRAMAPDCFIATRTNYLSRAMLAQELGADHVVVEEIATAEAMQREILAKLDARRKRRTDAAKAAEERDRADRA